jgi:hypothetical protein
LYIAEYAKKFMFEHCWNVLKYAPKWLNSHQNETPRRRRMETTSSLNSINLEDEDVANASNTDLETPLGRKAEKTRLNKQKSDKCTSSNVKYALDAMVEEKKKSQKRDWNFLRGVVLSTWS